MKDKRPIHAILFWIGGKPFLAPYTDADIETFAAIDRNNPVEITIKQRRSLPQLQAYWAMLQKVIEATDAYPTAEHLHEAIKFDLGYCSFIMTPCGDTLRMADSVAFSKMRAPEFREYFAKAEKLIAEQFGIDVQELRKAA